MMNDELDNSQVDITAETTEQMSDAEFFARMRALREGIKARRGGKLITTDIVEQVRAERDEELMILPLAPPGD